MSDIAGRIASLPPEKRALLAARLARVERSNRPLRADHSVEELVAAPLSYTQRGVWFLDQLYPGNVAYNSPIALRFSGQFSADALEWSWNQVVRRHDLLRTVFELRGGEPVQWATSFRPSTLRKMDFLSLPEGERMEAARQEAVREARQSIDLASGPPWRAKLLCCSEREHIFVVILHHIICDGWSVGVLVRELVTGYEAFLSGQTSLLPRPTIQYAHYAAAQRQQLAGPDFSRQVEAWRKRLAGFTEPAEIPSDRPRPAEPTFRGARLMTQLGPQLVESLRRVAHSEGATLFMVLLGAFKVLLARYSGHSDIIVGSPMAGRERREYEGLIGFFANTLALRTDLSGDLTFIELLARVREATLGAYDFREIPFEKLVEELRPERQANRNPFFDISFSLQNFPMPAVNVPDVSLELLRIDNGTSKFDLSIVMVESQGGFATTLEYSTDLFDASTVGRLLRHYVNLLQGIAENPRLRISQFELLTKTERAQILVEWNATKVDFPRDRCIHELFQDQARQTPHKVAVVYGEQRLCYCELDVRSSQLARYLRSLGVRAGAKVAICLEPSTEMTVGLLGILKAGAAYVPVDPNYPRERISFIVAEIEARVVLTQKNLASRFLGMGLRAVCLEADWDMVESTTEAAGELCGPEAIAYVLFTSGSTGTPKGVCVPHRGVNRLVVNCGYVQLGSEDVVAQVSNLSFDAATFEVWGALLNGSRLVGISQDDLLSPDRFSKELARHGVTTLLLTTAVFNVLAYERPDIFRNLPTVLFGGEECDADAVRNVLENGPPQRLLNVYGPTETTTFATTYRITPADQRQAGRIPIGRPIANTQVYILDSHRKPVPIGVTGEIWIGGDGVANCYLRRPELTAERFINSPFVAGQRLFRTGDLGRFLANGNMEFLGRLDHQVKIRGFRIELGEVEAALVIHPKVRQAVVCVREDETIAKTRQLVAYVVPAQGGSLEGLNEMLSVFLKEKLPDYMVPSAFVILEEFPLTPNGKIDRQALPSPDWKRETYRAARIPEEEILCGIYADLLSLSHVGIDDSFFFLGGHSLLAMQLINRIRSAFGVELSVRVVFEAPTVAQLVTRLPAARKVRASLERQERPERPPLSFAQQRLWFLDRLETSSAEYNMTQALRLQGELNVGAMERAMHKLIARHEILRTHFEEHEGEPYQVVAPDAQISLRIQDLSHLEEEGQQDRVRATLQREAERPFILKQAPLLRVGLLKLASQDHIFYWTCHHVVSDGWSAEIFRSELSTLYTASLDGRSGGLAELPVQYVDYALWQRRQMGEGALAGQLDYWRHQLSGLPVLELPTDRPREPSPNFAGEAETFLLGESLCRDLRSLSSREGASLAMLLLAAFELLLGRLSGQDDLTLGLPIAGRTSSESERLIGLFVNTLVIRAKLVETRTFRQFLAHVRKTSLEAYAHQDVPFEKLVEVLNPERLLNRHPLFEVLFNYQGFSRTSWDLPGLSVEPLRRQSVQAKFPMTLYLEETSAGVMLRLVYQTALFSPKRIGHVLAQFHHLLEQVGKDPDRTIYSYSLITEGARKLLPDPTVSLAEPEQLPAARQFLAIAQRHPEQVALQQQGQRMTYRQLATAAERIAAILADRSVQPGDVVAISGPSSFGLISGIMGVLLARGVLLLLDSSLPSARRDMMLQIASGRHWLRIGEAQRANEEWSASFQSLPHTSLSIEGLCEDAPKTILPKEASFDQISPEDPAYVFFTSGTTASPKGIVGTHKGLSHFLRWEQQTLGVSRDDRIAQLTGLSFDVVLRDIFLPLTAGATLCLPDAASASYDQSVVPWLLSERITILHAVPSLASAWLDSLQWPLELSDLRWVLFAGEPLTASLIDRWRESLGQAGAILNLYGPTETTLAKCAYPVPRERDPFVQPIGSPLPNTQALVVNQAGQLCGVGEPGEITIRTPFRTLGFLGGPEVRAGFVPNPFRDDHSDIVYRTGDRGSYDFRGLLLISGRLDDQIKIRGNRVEPAEIVGALARHPDIQQSAIVMHEEPGGEKFLVAYIVEKPDHALAESSELRSFLKRSLPDYMIPALFVRLDNLPLTPNGKLDRRALPAPDSSRLRQSQDFVAPRTSVEILLAALWGRLLNLEEIGIRDDFFELGGHSLTATRLVSHIRRECNVEIPVRAIFENPTIEALARQIIEQGNSMKFGEIEEFLRDVGETDGQSQVAGIEERSPELPLASTDEDSDQANGSQFSCPHVPSRFFGARPCNLVIVINERFDRESFEQAAGHVRQFDPSITVLVTDDSSSRRVDLPDRPSLIFSPALIRHRPRMRGCLFCGYPFRKSEEYRLLEKAGIAVPKWTLLSERNFPDLSEFDDYVVKKPDRGGRGAGVKIVRKGRVKWKPVTTRSAGASSSLILQQFIYTGPRPVSYRVTTLFGKVLHSQRYELHQGRTMKGAEDFRLGGLSIVASAKDSEARLNCEADIIELGEQAHAAFPQIPLLGFDIVREVSTGKLFVLEANAIGYVWNFGARAERSFGLSLERQFDGVRKAAYILAEKTQHCAL